MSNTNYTLEIISHHPKFSSKPLRKYYVDGIETVGAWGDEPFEIRFKNNTWQKIQVKLSLDGTDILSGKPADTEVSSDMWVVNGYATLSLKAWPETNNGGASFVFTSADKSVALHTHGDMSSRGIIAAAVFTEGHVEPITYTYPIYNTPVIWPVYEPHWTLSNIPYKGSTVSGRISKSLQSDYVYTNNSCNNAGGEIYGADSFSFNDASPAGAAMDSCEIGESSLRSLVSVGAGQHVDQKITYVSGLIKPVFTETVRVKYVWWDDLVDKLRTNTVAQPHASGFPGDKTKGIDLKGTPRVGEGRGSFRRSEVQQPVFSRF